MLFMVFCIKIINIKNHRILIRRTNERGLWKYVPNFKYYKNYSVTSIFMLVILNYNI